MDPNQHISGDHPEMATNPITYNDTPYDQLYSGVGYDDCIYCDTYLRYLFAIPQIGLTGSMPIIDPVSGELYNPHDNGCSQISYDNWRSWIFESHGEPQMIASSDGKVLRDAKETEGFEFNAHQANISHMPSSHKSDIKSDIRMIITLSSLSNR
eukprot:931366_1